MQQTREICPGVHWVGALNASLRVFDIIMKTDWGTTYNSYLVQGERTALIDTVHADFTPEFLAKLESVIPLEKLDYLIISHTEMDHSGSVAALLLRAPHLEVFGTKSALHLLKNIANVDFKGHPISDNEVLDLGAGKTLRFIPSPFWHWPDSMFTYLESDGLLFPCDGFATHYCDERLFEDRMPDFTAESKFYFDHIMRPYKDKVPAGCAKVRALPALRMICPSHGPMLRQNPMRIVDLWDEWARPEPKQGKEVAILYASAYGATKAMAESLLAGIEASGVRTSVVDLTKAPVEEWLSAMERADGILLGSPTLNGDAVKPVWDAIALTALVNTKGKRWGAFGSYGWSGEATKLLLDRMKGLKFAIAEDRLTAILIPSAEELSKCAEYGQQFAASLQ